MVAGQVPLHEGTVARCQVGIVLPGPQRRPFHWSIRSFISLEYYVLGMLLLSIMTGSIDGHASKPSGEGGMVRGRWLCDLVKSWPLLAKHHQAVGTVVEIPTLLNQTS